MVGQFNVTQMTCCCVAYAPPKGILHSEAFVSNITHWDCGLPLYLMSNDPNWGSIPCADPEILKHPSSRYRIANMIFLMALKLAMEKGYSHMLFVESDSRLRGDGWAWLLWKEFLSYPNAIWFGTPAFYNISRINNATPRKIVEFVADSYKASGNVVSVYGMQPSVTGFINGSLAIYDVSVTHAAFKTLGFDDDLVACGRTGSPFDVSLGRALSIRYGIRMLDLIAPSALSYSSVDRIYNEEARMNMLRSGDKVAIHPIKSAWNGLD